MKKRHARFLLLIALAVSLCFSAAADQLVPPAGTVETDSAALVLTAWNGSKAAENKTGMTVTATGSAKAGIGKKVTFTVKVARASGKVSYKWQESTNGKKWTNSKEKGAKTKKLTLTVKEDTFGKQYRCVVKDSKGSKNSNIVRVEAPFTLSVSPKNATLAIGKKASFTAQAKGTAGKVKYQWTYSADGGKTWKKSKLAGSAKKTLKPKVTEEMYGWLFRCEVTDNNGTLVSSSVYVEPVNGTNFTYEMNDGYWMLTGVRGKQALATLPAGHQGIYVTSVADGAFRGNKAFTEVTVPDSYWHIGNEAFKGCTKLEHIYLSRNLGSIGEEAFSGCVKLRDVFLPDDINSIGFSTFKGLPDFAVSFNANTKTMKAAMQTALNYDIWYDTYHLWVQNKDSGKYEGYAVVENSFARTDEGKPKPTRIEVPEGIEVIVVEAFANYTGQYSDVTEVRLPSTAGLLDEGAFRGCTSLKTINLDKVYVIGEGAFLNCSSLGETTLRTEAGDVTLHGGFKGIGGSAFDGCSSLILRVVQGTYAYLYAVEHNIPYVTYNP